MALIMVVEDDSALRMMLEDALIMSAKPAMREVCEMYGMGTFLAKPINIKVLKETIAKLLGPA